MLQYIQVREMEKNKYQRSTREEKKEARTAFFNTDFGRSLKIRLTRLVIYSILLVVCAIYFIIDNILNDNSIGNYILAAFFIIFAIIFMVGRHYVIVKNANDYMIKNKKKK